WISEAVNGWIKRILGFRQFSVRGLNNASGEWDLVCLAINLRRMRPLIVLQ
ncbi:MAG: transposase, partial [Proteobacteria bacterium]|nr:transposase [Pseudomonadota bacterium]